MGMASSPGRAWMAALVAAVVGVSAAVPSIAVPVAATEESELPAMMLVMDASGSMDEASGAGGTRMEAAEGALAEVMAAVPDETQVGLRVFGGEESDNECANTRLEVPVGPVDRAAIDSVMGGLGPAGATPLADSIEAAADDLPDDMPGMIIVVTDGEDTCEGDPCEIAGQLVQSGIDVRVDVVGFQVAADEQGQLECIAESGGGTYFEAHDADSLAAQLRRAAVRGLRVFTPEGIPIEGTNAPQSAPSIEEGRYLDELRGDQPRHYEVEVPVGETLWAAATTTTTLASLTATAEIELTVTSASGSQCASESGIAVGASGRGMPLTAAVLATADDLEACGAGPHVMRVVQAQDGESADRPVELLVGFEPAVTSTGGLPPPAGDGSWEGEASSGGTPEPVIGSPNIASATPVGPGRYSDTILVGETLFYGVELDWGQQLVCEATLGADAVFADALGRTLPAARTHMFAPFRAELYGPEYQAGGIPFDATEEMTFTSTTPPVRYLNRDAVLSKYASLAGTYYCAVKMAGNTQDAGAGEIPLELVIDVVGTTAGAPEYLVEEEAEPTPTPTEIPTDPVASPDEPEAAESEGLPTWVALSGVFLLGLLVAAAVALLLNRRKVSASRSPTAQ